jgi:hypothetical protein
LILAHFLLNGQAVEVKHRLDGNRCTMTFPSESPVARGKSLQVVIE